MTGLVWENKPAFQEARGGAGKRRKCRSTQQGERLCSGRVVGSKNAPNNCVVIVDRPTNSYRAPINHYEPKPRIVKETRLLP